MDFPQLTQRYAVVKLYPGLDETIFRRLLNSLGLDAVFTNDPSEYSQIGGESTCANTADPNVNASVEDTPQVHVKMDEWSPLLEIMEANANMDRSANNEISSSHEVTVQCKIGEPITLLTDELSEQTLNCMLCQQQVPRDKKSLKSHAQTHSGKRYCCSRCKYHTDRKFDFTRHLRRRHEGEPDPLQDGARPHWMSVLRSCFPSYDDVTKYRKHRRSKTSTARSDKCGKPPCDDKSIATVQATDCSTTVC